ncbi:TrkH family potassium uptake protein [Aliiruegeria lutimaris]|uniref:Trk system potassium uptake protein n=1 Tax=Aliiruegeria lutimaris TaxID=571298 RepID=A0A1G8M2U5_9RHOB|nr:TrkH family potassium uptake protein [Aliiruegeria lutimaris]SDI62183.1 trk system potassium uptake protein TrkH [Aliiruegeria lutimaris]
MQIRPVINITGYLAMVMGVLMLVCGVVDAFGGRQSGLVFFLDGVIVLFLSACVVLATTGASIRFMDRRQAFLLTSLVWSVLPAVGAIPFVLGIPHASLVDAYFEAMSGMTTTGSTVFHGLENLPHGVLLWRGILQWLGGLGIVIVAMIFLPAMRVGGMQFFLTEGFDTLGKIMPRAMDIALSLLRVYILLTLACLFTYMAFHMSPFDAIVHAMTTISTGGFSTSDASFAPYKGPLEYVSSLYMILASFPLVRLVQLLGGRPGHLFRDPQVRVYLQLLILCCGMLVLYRLVLHQGTFTDILRETVFNVVTLFSGTGYASEDITRWGGFALTVVFIAGLIGGCTGSTACSVKIFRWLVLWQSVKQMVKQMRSRSAVVPLRLSNKRLQKDVIDSVMAFFTLFILTLGLTSVGIALTGLSFQTSVTAAWTSVANIGPAFGEAVGASGSLEAFPATAKWIMIFGMLAGRLEILSLYVLFTRRFWTG